MPGLPFIARLFWTVGLVLVVVGLVLWFTLPIHPMFPPYLATGIVCAAYGEYCRRRVAHAKRPKP